MWSRAGVGRSAGLLGGVSLARRRGAACAGPSAGRELFARGKQFDADDATFAIIVEDDAGRDLGALLHGGVGEADIGCVRLGVVGDVGHDFSLALVHVVFVAIVGNIALVCLGDWFAGKKQFHASL